MAGRAVVLLSGGLDSAATAALALREGHEVTAVSFDYGQRHRSELDAARAVARHLGIDDHRLVQLDPSAFLGSALTIGGEVPVDREAGEMAGSIPDTYVPARNTIFLSYGLGIAETLGTGDVFIGANAVDYSGYPDCRPEFLEAFERMANLATKGAVEGTLPVQIHAPLVTMTKAEIILVGTGLGVDFSLTVSCYQADPDGQACGRCDSCRLRRQGFEAAGLDDPTRYAAA